MTRYIILLMMLGLCVSISWSQTSTKSIIASTGQQDVVGEITIDWTLGEWQVNAVQSKDNLYTQGFHQPIIKPVAVRVNPDNPTLLVEISPNPVLQMLQISSKADVDYALHINLFDISGKNLIAEKPMNSSGKAEIDMSLFETGLYIINIRDQDGNYSESFKIIKSK